MNPARVFCLACVLALGVTLSAAADAQPAGKAGVSSTELADAAAATKQANKATAKSAADPVATPAADTKKSARAKSRSVRNGDAESSRDESKGSSGEAKSSKKARRSSKKGDKASSGEGKSSKKDDKASSRDGKSSKKGDKAPSGEGKSSKKDDKASSRDGKSSKSAGRSGPKGAAGGTADHVDSSAAAERARAAKTSKGEADDRVSAHDDRLAKTKRSSPKERAAKAGAGDKARHEPKRREPPGRSIGAPNHGRLADGAKLDPSKVLRIAPGAQRWALPVLVHALERIAGVLARDHKSPPMFVGDLSAQRGGKLGPHRSHQSGRDVDIGFYATDLKGRPVKMNRWVAFDGKGRARDGSAMRFDDARNWALVRALVEDTAIRVRYMFITQELEDRIIAYATKRGAKRATVARAAEVMQSPQDVDLHDNHIHVRIDCPAHTRDACVPESVRGYDDDAPAADVAGYAAAYSAPALASPAREPGLAAPALDGAGPHAEPNGQPDAEERLANEPPPVPAGAAPSDI